MQRIFSFIIFSSVLIISVLGAESYTTPLYQGGTLREGNAEKQIQLDIGSSDYFEAGFATEPYNGGSPVFTPDDAENNAIVLTADYESLTASSEIYVYWFYGTSKSLNLEVGCSSLSSGTDSIPLTISYGSQSISSDDADKRLPVFGKESSAEYEIGYGSTASALEIVSGSLSEKNVGTYTGYITLYITD